MNTAVTSPRAILEAWISVLLAPTAWAISLGVLYSLTDETCAHSGRGTMFAIALGCIALAIAPAPLAWHWRRSIEETSSSGERARFMLQVAAGCSLLFTLVTIVNAVPIAFLDPCRT
jgi:hypothetical protein